MKEQILDTCTRLFEQKGFSETSIQEIVEELGVTKGTFYYYFTSKEQVLVMIHRKYIDSLLEQQQIIMEKAGLSNREKLRALIYLLLKNIEPLGDSARVFYREFRNLNEKHMAEVRKKRNQVRFAFQEVIEAGMESGEFKPNLVPEIVTLGILGACNWTYQWYKPDGTHSTKEISSIYSDMICQGIEK